MIQSRNLFLAIFVLVAALFLYFYLCPYIGLIGGNGLCIMLYVVLILFYFYMRVDRKPVRSPRNPPPPPAALR